MSRGKDWILSCAKGSAWFTAVDADNTNAGFLCTNVAGFIEIPEPLLDEHIGQTYPQYIDAGNRTVHPVLTGDLRWANEQYKLLCAVIGDDALTGGASPYTHTMDVQATQTLFHTLCGYDGVTVREIPSFKATGFTLSGQAGGFWQFEIRGIGNTCLVTGQVNTTLSSVTYRTKEKRVPFGATQIRINDQGGSGLGSGDVVYPSSIQIVFNRDIPPEFVARAVAEGSGEWQTREPVENSFIDCQVTLGFNEFAATTYMADMTAEDFKKMDLTITGLAISGGNYSHVMSFPALRVINVEHGVSSPGRIPETITMRALQAQAAPTGMSGITNILRWIFTDDVSTAYDV